jgi:uncharacterized protein (DUF58 family)
MLNFFRKPRKPTITVAVAKKPLLLTLPPPQSPVQLLRRLEWKVLRRLDGFLFGDYSGIFYGPSLDLAEVREYQPGDEVRRMDWNVTARMGRLHVRQYREEHEVTLWLIVDRSPSMFFGTRERLKIERAAEFAGLAALIATRRGDKVGAMLMTEGGKPLVLTPNAGRMQALQIMQRVLGPQSTNPPKPTPTSLAEGIASVDRSLKRRGLVFVLSDFSDSNTEAWSRALGNLSRRHDVVLVRLQDPAERELPNAGPLRLRDPESGQELWLNTSDPQVRARFGELVAERDRAFTRAARSAQVDSIEINSSDLLKPLLGFAARRRGLRQAGGHR